MGQPTTPSVPGVPISGMVDTSHWGLWWGFNRHPFLELKRHVTRGGETTGGDDFTLGEGLISNNDKALRPDERVIREQIVPELLTALAGEENKSIVTATLIALAKIGDGARGSSETSLREVFLPYLASPNQEIAETAALALGILGDQAAGPILAELLGDSPAGQAAVGGGRVPDRTRAFAAFALGLLGNDTEREDVRRYVVHHLTSTVAERGDERRDVEVACVLAVGIVGLQATPGESPEGTPPSTSRAGQVAWLMGIVEDERRDAWTRAHAVTSLGRLVGSLPEDSFGAIKARVAERLLHETRVRSKAPAHVKQSCVLALGALGDADEDDLDDDIRDRLRGVIDGHGAQEEKNFALMALAQSAIKNGLGEKQGEGLDEVQDYLLKQLDRGRSGRRIWAGLGIGVLVHGRTARGHLDNNARLVEALRLSLLDARSPDPVAAYCLGAGMAGDLPSGDYIATRIPVEGSDWIRGYQALGLGLMGHLQSVESLRGILADSLYRPDLLAQTGTSLALLGDKQAVPMLIAMLRDSSSLATQASLAVALGLIGDARSVDPLIEMLRDDSLTSGARAYASAALGGVTDRRDLPWGSVYTTGINYAATTETLFNAYGSGLLNLL